MKTKVIYSNNYTYLNFNFFKFSNHNKHKKLDNNSLLCFVSSVCEFLKINSDIVFCIESSIHTLKKEYQEEIKTIISKIKQGFSFSNACKEIFPNYAIRLIKLGEKNNNFQETFKMLKDLIDSKINQKKKLINSLSYPSFTFGVFLIVIALFSKVIIPSIHSLLIAIDPANTNNFYLFEYFLFILKTFCLMMLLFSVFLLFLYCFYKNNFEKLLIQLPVVGNLFKFNAISIVSYYIFSCLKSGVSITEALNIAIEANSGFLKEILISIKNDLSKGLKVYHSLKKFKQIPNLVINTIQTGENASNLNESFLLVYKIYEQKHNAIVEKLSIFLPMFLIIFIAVIMIFFVFVVFMPIYNIGI